MGKRIIKLNERQLNKIVKRVLSESYEGGIVQSGDKPCVIWCKQKTAKMGSNGDTVKYIQHLLAANGFNPKYQGGGIGGDCFAAPTACDGKYRRHTKDAVLEFQSKYGLTPDGVVGYDTLSKMCEVLRSSDRHPASKSGFDLLCNNDCNCRDNYQGDYDQNDDYLGDDNQQISDDIDCDDLRDCVDKYIFGGTKPDMGGFISCYYKKDIPVGVDKPFCSKCKEMFPNNYVNLMPYTGPRNDEEERKRELGRLCIKKCDGFKAAY